MRLLDNVTYKPMMGEFLLYYKNKLFGGIYDDRLLVKKTKTNEKFDMTEGIPYSGAKFMFMVEDIDDAEKLKEIVRATCEGL